MLLLEYVQIVFQILLFEIIKRVSFFLLAASTLLFCRLKDSITANRNHVIGLVIDTDAPETPPFGTVIHFSGYAKCL